MMDQQQIQDHFINQYRSISAKIKKRFLRKPNIAEASEEFSKLARKLNDTEALPQAGLCCLAVARCEQSLCNPMTEVASLVEAARDFMKAEEINHLLECPAYNEHMVTAISSYQLAFKIYFELEKQELAASLLIELSEHLLSLGHASEALSFAEEAVDLLKSYPMYLIPCYNRMAACKIELGDLSGALKTYFEISKLIYEQEKPVTSGCFLEIITQCEISSLILLLTLQPLTNQLKPDQTRLLDKYSWNASEETMAQNMLDNRELTILLQSLVLACQTRDVDSMSELAEKLTSKLSGQSLELLQILLTEMNRF